LIHLKGFSYLKRYLAKKHSMKFCFISLLLLVAIQVANAQNSIFPNFAADEFQFRGHQAVVIKPNITDTNKHWIWRARFWGHEPQLDKALLNEGFHIVYVGVANLFGNNEAVDIWNDFYTFVRKEYGLNERVVLEGMSRGGLIIFNWAAQNTEKVACIYADAPVCDIRSWPGGKFSGKGSGVDWQRCLTAHNISEETGATYEQIPLFTCVAVAKASIPTIFVCGDADGVVPFSENAAVVIQTMEANGNSPTLILKKGIGHHPHSLADPSPIKNFILASLN
jgi:pimeloyl-ACP methyl ester carboxylesterase